jgi:hypothetical protein
MLASFAPTAPHRHGEQRRCSELHLHLWRQALPVERRKLGDECIERPEVHAFEQDGLNGTSPRERNAQAIAVCSEPFQSAEEPLARLARVACKQTDALPVRQPASESADGLRQRLDPARKSFDPALRSEPRRLSKDESKNTRFIAGLDEQIECGSGLAQLEQHLRGLHSQARRFIRP